MLCVRPSRDLFAPAIYCSLWARAAPRCERPHTISTPETTNPPCRRVCHIKGSALQLRTGLDDGFGHIELLEVLDEQAGQIPGGGIVGSRVSPGVAGVQQLAVDTLNGLGHVQVDDRDVLGLGTDQSAGLDGGDDGPGSGDAEAGAHTVTTAGPTGVDQVDLAAE